MSKKAWLSAGDVQSQVERQFTALRGHLSNGRRPSSGATNLVYMFTVEPPALGLTGIVVRLHDASQAYRTPEFIGVELAVLGRLHRAGLPVARILSPDSPDSTHGFEPPLWTWTSDDGSLFGHGLVYSLMKGSSLNPSSLTGLGEGVGSVLGAAHRALQGLFPDEHTRSRIHHIKAQQEPIDAEWVLQRAKAVLPEYARSAMKASNEAFYAGVVERMVDALEAHMPKDEDLVHGVIHADLNRTNLLWRQVDDDDDDTDGNDDTGGDDGGPRSLVGMQTASPTPERKPLAPWQRVTGMVVPSEDPVHSDAVRTMHHLTSPQVTPKLEHPLRRSHTNVKTYELTAILDWEARVGPLLHDVCFALVEFCCAGGRLRTEDAAMFMAAYTTHRPLERKERDTLWTYVIVVWMRTLVWLMDVPQRTSPMCRAYLGITLGPVRSIVDMGPTAFDAALFPPPTHVPNKE